MMMTSASVDDDGDSDDKDANNNDGSDGNSNNGEVEHDGGDNNDNEDEDNFNIDVVKDDGDDGMTMMRWQQGRMDYDDAMVMVGQRHAEHLRAPRHPSKATINLCRQFG